MSYTLHPMKVPSSLWSYTWRHKNYPIFSSPSETTSSLHIFLQFLQTLGAYLTPKITYRPFSEITLWRIINLDLLMQVILFHVSRHLPRNRLTWLDFLSYYSLLPMWIHFPDEIPLFCLHEPYPLDGSAWIVLFVADRWPHHRVLSPFSGCKGINNTSSRDLCGLVPEICRQFPRVWCQIYLLPTCCVTWAGWRISPLLTQ